jgi:hypothetical protein
MIRLLEISILISSISFFGTLLFTFLFNLALFHYTAHDACNDAMRYAVLSCIIVFFGSLDMGIFLLFNGLLK